MNALIYRATAVYWNYARLEKAVLNCANAISKQESISEHRPLILSHLYPISFSLDDVIFNLVSMTDYLAALLILIVKKNPSERNRWNQLVKNIKNQPGFESAKLAIADVHKTYFDRLSEYRADVYHRKAQFSSAETWFDFDDGSTNVAFLLPINASKLIPDREKRSKIDLIDGTSRIMTNCFVAQKELIEECSKGK
jgi:hypothetical protein